MSIDERQEKARPALEFAFADQFSSRGAGAQLKLHPFSTKMMRFLLFRVYGQKCMVFDGLGFTVQKI